MKRLQCIKKYIRPLDAILIVLLCVLSVFTLFFMPEGGDTVTIFEQGQIIYSGSIWQDNVITAALGENIITIQNGRVYMSHSECPDHICESMGDALPQRPVSCLPNKILIVINYTHNSSYELDGVVY